MSVRGSSAIAALGTALALAGVARGQTQAADPTPSAPAVAQADPLAPQASPELERRRPGRAARLPPNVPLDPQAVIPTQRYELYACEPSLGGGDLADHAAPCAPPVEDRWRLGAALGLVKPRLRDPYNQNVLKGDVPLRGTDDLFFVGSLLSDTVLEPRAFPVPVGTATTQRAGDLDPFGRPDSLLFSQTVLATAQLIRGATAFKPQERELHLTLAVNLNYAWAQERRILSVRPTDGTTRFDGFFGVQEAFVEQHLRDVSDRYDFDAIRVGIQPFSSDFRGFLFQDQQPGVRLFGDRDNNRLQYNLAVFGRLDKDTNSGLNDITAWRKEVILIANLYRQDLPLPGITSQITLIGDIDGEGGDVHFDSNGFPSRPELIGDGRGRDYEVAYLGYNIDGRLGRWNLTGSTYLALGRDHANTFTAKDATIAAWFAAAEVSRDFSWLRVRGSALYASGDDNPYDNTETGFDAIFENPQFAGADTSFWIRQSIPFIGGGQGVSLSGRNGVLPDLRTSKEEGQSNFINPGLLLLGLGADADVLPELRATVNANHLRFAETAPLEALRQQGHIDNDLGWDLSAALTWRPWFIQNVVLRASAAILVPGEGFQALFDAPDRRPLYYSLLFNAVLSY